MAPAAQLALTIGAWVLLVLLLTAGFWFLRQHQLLYTPLILILLCLGIFLPAGTDRWRAVGRHVPGRVGEAGHRRHEPCGPLWRGGDGL
jgi:predicted tellurium resistance membrane protein TerC